MTVEHAETADIALLTELRLAYLKEDYGDLSGDDIEKIRRDLPGYFEKNLCVVELKSTEAGHHLYQAIGFQDEVSKYHPMKWYNAK